jgi:hypothetical protein
MRRFAINLIALVSVNFAAVSLAHAGMLPSGPPVVLVSDSEMVFGGGSAMTELALPSTGELFITVTDLAFPVNFASLDFSVSEPGVTLVPLQSAGTVSLSITQPETLFADLYWTTQGIYNTGLYNITATFLPESVTAVPLPGSASLLMLGLMLLALLFVDSASMRSRGASGMRL